MKTDFVPTRVIACDVSDPAASFSSGTPVTPPTSPEKLGWHEGAPAAPSTPLTPYLDAGPPSEMEVKRSSRTRFWIEWVVIIVAALFAMVSFATALKKFESEHLREFAVVMIFLIAFFVVLYVAGARLGDMYGPTLVNLEVASSP